MVRGWLSRTDWIATALIGALVAVCLVWNISAGLTWKPGLWTVLMIPAWPLACAIAYRLFRPGPSAIFEACLYIGLGAIGSFFGVRLSYLAASAGFPLQDRVFTAADKALGFQWLPWAHFVTTHPLLLAVHTQTYVSSELEATLVAIAVAFARIPGRNAQLLIAMVIAVFLTVGIFMIAPSMGPAFDNGVKTHIEEILISLRSHDGKALDYAGVIQFPSFHTAMALLFVWASRGIKWVFWPLACFNAVMLTSVPFSGDHYLVDLIGGVAVAYVAASASKLIFVAEPARLELVAG